MESKGIAQLILGAMNKSPATSERCARDVADSIEKMLDTAPNSIERVVAKNELSGVLMATLHRGLE